MIWMWVSTAIILIGAELNAELEHVALGTKVRASTAARQG
jgi:uncharacterized BrkB/YihY/UPF0761 family membrane protein